MKTNNLTAMKLVPITASMAGHTQHLLSEAFVTSDFNKACFISRIHEPRFINLLKALKKEEPELFVYEIHPARFNYSNLVKFIMQHKMQDFLQLKYISLGVGDWFQPSQETITKYLS